jgi:methionyl-tRNA synthetase
MTGSTIVSGAPPTPNGDLHLGHLSGPYSGADIYARARRLLGQDAVYLVGSDIYQSYVPMKALQLGVDADTLAKGFDDEIRALFSAMDFSVAGYVRPQESRLHQQMVREFFATLHERGRLEERTEECLYCESCARYLHEAHLTGCCPHCGDDDCDGNLCEVCAWPNAVVDLVGPRCNHCGQAPVRREFTRLVFPLSQYGNQLREYHRSVIMSPQLETLCQAMLDAGLPDIPVSHPTDWGSPMPVPGFGEQRIFVWAEMVPGYFAELAEALASAGEDPSGWRNRWDRSETVQFFGWDNGYFHALLHPALMMAYDDGLRLPAAFVTNEFYLLDSAKFSTSRRHAIWGTALLGIAPSDCVRFALAHDRPQFARTNFTFDRFRSLVDGELAGTWQPWLDGFFQRLATHCGGVVPGLTGATGSQERFAAGLATLAGDCLAAYGIDQFSPRRAARCLRELVARAAEFAAGQQRCLATSGSLAQRRTAVAAEAQAVKLLAQLSAPLMPGFAAALWRALGMDGMPAWDDLAVLPEGQVARMVSGAFFQPLPADLEDRLARY